MSNDGGSSWELALSRRTFLSRTAAVGGGLAAGNLLAACGEDDGGGEQAPRAGKVPTGPALGRRLRELLGEPENLLRQGPGTFPIMGSWALTGQGSIYGKLQTEGFRLGSEHVAAWTNGKLKFDLEALDHKSGDPQALVANVRKAGRAKIPILITSYIFGFGAQTAAIEQYKMLSLDPGGGTGPLLKGVPYCYGFKASYPTDLQDGLYRAVKELYPEVKRIAALDVQIAAPYNDAVKAHVEKLVNEHGLELISYTTAPIAKTDYSSTITEIRGDEPDAILCSNFGTDIGYLARDIQRVGIQGLFGAVDFTPDGAKIAGPAFRDWIFGLDYINAKNPPSDWSKLFVAATLKEHNDVQNFHASYYVSAFAFAITMDRILGAGGDIRNGDDWVEAFESDPTFPHVYGGSGKQLGEITIDPETHSPESIAMLVLKAGGTASTRDFEVLATFDIGGRDFQKA